MSYLCSAVFGITSIFWNAASPALPRKSIKLFERVRSGGDISRRQMFGVDKPVIGMLHIPSLPGAPLNKLDLKAITRWVIDDAKALTDGGVDGLLLENFGDIPFYPQQVPP